MIVIQFVEENNTIIFADIVKGLEFVKSLSRRMIRDGKIIVEKR